jgi:hypothetical protein
VSICKSVGEQFVLLLHAYREPRRTFSEKLCDWRSYPTSPESISVINHSLTVTSITR